MGVKRFFVLREELQTLVLRFDVSDSSMSIFVTDKELNSIDFESFQDAPVILSGHGTRCLAHALLNFLDAD